jgi:hypothetical protein
MWMTILNLGAVVTANPRPQLLADGHAHVVLAAVPDFDAQLGQVVPVVRKRFGVGAQGEQLAVGANSGNWRSEIKDQALVNRLIKLTWPSSPPSAAACAENRALPDGPPPAKGATSRPTRTWALCRRTNS